MNHIRQKFMKEIMLNKFLHKFRIFFRLKGKIL